MQAEKGLLHMGSRKVVLRMSSLSTVGLARNGLSGPWVRISVPLNLAALWYSAIRGMS